MTGAWRVRRIMGGYYLGTTGWVRREQQARLFPSERAATLASAYLGQTAYVEQVR